MSLSKSDLPYIQWSLLAFTFSLAVGGSAIWLGAVYESTSLKALHAAQNQVSEARNELGSSRADLENMSTYALEYASLMDRKIVGGEQRLDWMEELEKLRRQHHVIDFKYTIAPQQVFTATPALDTGDLEIYLSGVNLQIHLLHEMQLIEFFDALRTDMKGGFIIDHCMLERAAAKAEEAAATQHVDAQLKADCAGGWITLKNRSAQ